MNDSAVCHYYDPGALARGSEKKITLVLGKYSPAGLSAESAVPESRTAALSPQEAAEEKRISEAIAALRTEIAGVNKLLSDIDTKVSLGGALADQDVATLEATLADLKNRAAKYGTGFGK
jgi:hypothetical protein